MNINDRVSLNHLDRMTDSTGLIQHAIYGIPRRESGYTTDDNARALRLCVRLWRQHPEERLLNRAAGYLSFLEFARCPGRGFHNFLSYDRRWLDAEGCGDCQGQAVRALAEVLGSDLPDDFGKLARELIEAILPALADLRSLRAQAYVILAWGDLWKAGVKDVESLENVAWSAAERLVECYNRNRWSGLALVRIADDLCQRGPAARPVYRRPALAERELSRNREGFVRFSRPRNDRQRGLPAGRQQRLVSPRGRNGPLRPATGRSRHDGRGRARRVRRPRR